MTAWQVVAAGVAGGAVGGLAARRVVSRYRPAAPTSGETAGALGPFASQGPVAGVFEMLGAGVCGLLGAVRPFPDVLGFWWLVVVGLALGYVDLTSRRLPNPLCLTAYLGVSASLTLAALAHHDPGALLRALAGGLVLGVAFLTLALARPADMGLGDAKLAASLGTALAWISWPTLLTGTLAAFCLAALPIAITALHHSRDPHRPIPFGPALLAGTVLVLLVT